MEQIANNDYQEIYRIKDGVLLYINKFENVIFPNHRNYFYAGDVEKKQFGEMNSKELSIVTKEQIVYSYETKGTVLIKKDTVLHQGYVVHPTADRSKWWYKITSIMDYFSGDLSEMQNYITEIQNLLKSKEPAP